MEPFYNKGLKFTCTVCHACCRHDPGFVFLSQSDLHLMINYLKIDEKEFVQKYCRWVDHGEDKVLSLNEKSNFDCIFWKDGCTVYPGRPVQCRTYPFWQTPLQDASSWKWEGKFCPGIGQGKLHSLEEIESYLQNRRENPPITKGDFENEI